MKKLFGIALLCALVLVLAGCPNPADSNSGEEKITIETFDYVQTQTNTYYDPPREFVYRISDILRANAEEIEAETDPDLKAGLKEVFDANVLEARQYILVITGSSPASITFKNDKLTLATPMTVTRDDVVAGLKRAELEFLHEAPSGATADGSYTIENGYFEMKLQLTASIDPDAEEVN